MHGDEEPIPSRRLLEGAAGVLTMQGRVRSIGALLAATLWCEAHAAPPAPPEPKARRSGSCAPIKLTLNRDESVNPAEFVANFSKQGICRSKYVAVRVELQLKPIYAEPQADEWDFMFEIRLSDVQVVPLGRRTRSIPPPGWSPYSCVFRAELIDTSGSINLGALLWKGAVWGVPGRGMVVAKDSTIELTASDLPPEPRMHGDCT